MNMHFSMVHTVCHRGFLNISADEKSRRLFVAIGALRVKAPIFFVTFELIDRSLPGQFQKGLESFENKQFGENIMIN